MDKWCKSCLRKVLSLLLIAAGPVAPAYAIELVSVSDPDWMGIQGNFHSHQPVVSADGRWMAFSSDASNLVVGDSNGKRDVFLRDLVTGSVVLASVSSSGAQGDGDSEDAVVSRDGRYVAFASRSRDWLSGGNGSKNVFLRDMVSRTTILISETVSGSLSMSDSGKPAMSGDGRYIAFSSPDSSLVVGDTNNHGDVFVRDTSSGTTCRRPDFRVTVTAASLRFLMMGDG
jgi:TolB protein